MKIRAAYDSLPAATDPIIDAARSRLKRKILYELQTGGGLDLTNLPRAKDIARLASTRDAIDALIDDLRALFVAAPGRAASTLGRPGLRILDVGSGKAPWSIALARQVPDATVTAIDLPEQIGALENAVRLAGLTDRFTFVGTDIFAPDFFLGMNFDVVILANVVHLFDVARNRELMRRITPYIAEAGALAIIDQMFEEDPDWERWSALYLLGVLHCSPGGFLFPERILVDWLDEFGTWIVDTYPLCPLPPLKMVLARRRASAASFIK